MVDLKQFIAELQQLLLAPVPEDPADDYIEWGTAPARLLAGLGPLWDRIKMDLRRILKKVYPRQFLEDVDTALEHLADRWGRLHEAYYSSDQDGIALSSREVHRQLASIANMMVNQTNELGVRLPSNLKGDYEQRRTDAFDLTSLFVTFAGIQKDIFESARALAFATTNEDPVPTGWDRVPASFPPISRTLERRAGKTGFGGRFDSA